MNEDFILFILTFSLRSLLFSVLIKITNMQSSFHNANMFPLSANTNALMKPCKGSNKNIKASVCLFFAANANKKMTATKRISNMYC